MWGGVMSDGDGPDGHHGELRSVRAASILVLLIVVNASAFCCIVKLDIDCTDVRTTRPGGRQALYLLLLTQINHIFLCKCFK